MCRKKMQTSFVIAAMIFIALTIFACEKAPEKVTYRLKWIFNTSAVGDLYADARGFFAENGLNLTLRAGGPERDAVKELELGHAQFGVASADQVIRALSKGAQIAVIAQLFQINPLQWVYRPEIRLESPNDLKGKTIGITYGGNDEAVLRALLAKYRISEKEVELFSVSYYYTPFYQRQVALWPVYRNAQGIIIAEKLRNAGEEVRFFDPDAFGIRFVANSVITTEHIMKKHPETVRKFIAALLRGWQESLDPANAEKAVEMIRRYDKDTPVEMIREQLNLTRPLVRPSPDSPIGKIDVKAWEQTETIMLEQKLIPEPVFVEKRLFCPVK